MRWRRGAIYAVLFLAATAALAGWQVHEYGHECQLARQTLEDTAQWAANMLVAGIRSHRRLGPYFEEQLQGTMEQSASSADVLAVGFVSADGRCRYFAGQERFFETPVPLESGQAWQPEGLRCVVAFHFQPEAAGGPFGPGGGAGGGRGWGRVLRQEAAAEDEESFWPGGDCAVVLVLDRKRSDQFCRQQFRLRFGLVVAGAVVFFCAGLAWWTTIRMVRLRGQAEVLQTEARHLREMSQAAAGLAHETRNPLGLIRGWTQRLAKTGVESATGRQQAQAVVEECDRVTARINQFLAFAKPVEPAPGPVDAERLIDELAVLLEPDLETKGLSLSRRRAATPALVRADREMLRQAIFNLVANAIEFASQGDAVEVAVRNSQDGLFRIEVADRGPGVPAEKVDSLFTPYFTTRSNGTGLGLAIARRIATAHGWQIGYSPRPGGGSIFWLDGIHAA